MDVTSAVRDSSVTLPIMPKAPASVNVAALMLFGKTLIVPANAATRRRTPKKTLDSCSVTKMSGNDV
jgi:hypothetical protein